MISHDALELFYDEARASVAPRHIDNTDTENIVLVPGATRGTFDTIRIPRNAPVRHHIATSLQGFIDFLNGPHCDKTTTATFVGIQEVNADLAYATHRNECAQLPLIHSPERAALVPLLNGVKAKELWRALVGPLAGHIDAALLGLVSSLKVVRNELDTVSIDAYGISSGGVEENVTINIGGEKAVIPLEWEFSGRLWDCWDAPIQVSLRLEVDTDHGLIFRFHAPELSLTEQNHRLALVEEIRSKCKGLAVYEASAH